MNSINRVLLIDDDEIVNSVNRVIINHAGFAGEVQTITEAKVALESLQLESENLPDLIFLDLNMPDMDGWDFVEAFGKLSFEKEIKVIMLTSSISEKDQKKAESYDVIAAFISKPLSPELLHNLKTKLTNPADS